MVYTGRVRLKPLKLARAGANWRLSKELEQLRELKSHPRRISQARLAQALRRSQSYVARLEGSTRILGAIEFLEISRALGLTKKQAATLLLKEWNAIAEMVASIPDSDRKMLKKARGR